MPSYAREPLTIEAQVISTCIAYAKSSVFYLKLDSVAVVANGRTLKLIFEKQAIFAFNIMT